MAAYLDPVNRAFTNELVRNTGVSLPHLSFVEARERLEELQKEAPAPDVATEHLEVSVGSSGKKVKTIVYRPAAAQGILPVIVYFHGGGWIMGGPATHGGLVRDLVRETGYAVVFPDYTHTPEAQYPEQFEESYAVIKYLVAHGAELGLKTDKLAFAGDSAGGHMTIAMSDLAVERHGPKIAYQVLFYPVTDFYHKERDTYEQFKDGPYLDVATLKWMKKSFIPHRNDRIGHLATPVLSTPEQAAKQPPTLIVVAAVDPLRSEGEAYGHVLQHAGVETAIFRADGQVHDFVMLNAVRKSPTGIATLELAALKLRKALA